MEHLSGMSLGDVKVHHNSDEPARLQAHAYAQGTNIHLGPGQETHLPHEAWHVVQQKQGRVKPTMQMKGKVNVNNDADLEKEADMMGAKALSFNTMSDLSHSKDLKATSGNVDSSDAPVQRRFGFEIEVPIFYTKEPTTHPGFRQDPGQDKLDQGSFEIHVDHNLELGPLKDYAVANQNLGWDGFPHGPSIIEIVTKPWDEFALTEQDVLDRAENIENWVQIVYDQGHDTEAPLGGEYYVGSDSPFNTLQSTLGYFQTTYGIKLSKTSGLFKQTGEAANRTDSRERLQFGDQLIKAGKIGKAVARSLKGYKVESGFFKAKVSSQVTRDGLNALAGYTTLLANYILAEAVMRTGIGLAKNNMGDYFYKTDLGSLSAALPAEVIGLLRNNDRVRARYIDLLSTKCDRASGDDMIIGNTTITIDAWVNRVLNGGTDIFLAAFKNPYSNELPSEAIGPVGNREAGVVMENRAPENLDPATRGRYAEQRREKAAFFDGTPKSPQDLAAFASTMADPKKVEISEWKTFMVRFYNLLREING